jgi:hypothetical protein
MTLYLFLGSYDVINSSEKDPEAWVGASESTEQPLDFANLNFSAPVIFLDLTS